MNVGDTIPVRIENFVVAQAQIEEVEDGRVTLYIPATRAVLGYTMSLSEKEPETDRMILGENE